MKLVTATQMRDLEQRAVDAGTPVAALMEAAGLAVAQEAWLLLGVVAGRRILVLAGPGNNGGDGLVAARHLAEWEGDVVVYLLAPRSDDDPNLARVRELDVPVFVASEDEGSVSLQTALDGAELVIDALLGTGRSRPIEGVLAEILGRLSAASERSRPPKVIAVDLPSGVDADSGTADDLAVRAEMTVTFGLAKVGLYTLPGSEYVGRVQVVDIGLPKYAESDLPVELISTAWVRERLPARPRASNKGTFGKVLVVGGSDRYVGAPRLAAEACYRAGAGLVTVACTERLQSMIAPSLAEAIWLPVASDGGMIAAAAADVVVEAAFSSDVMLMGPGLGQGGGVGNFVPRCLAKAPADLQVVIDADALNALAARDGWSAALRDACVLTPHPGEMARLLRTSVEAVQADRLNVAVKAADEWRQVVVLKGAHTVVAAPDGRAAISPYANPLLASAGTGDVLAGAIAGLLAQGVAPFEAAACAVYLHGFAAEELAEELGDRGLLASDLLAALPRAMRIVLQGRKPAARTSGDFGALSAFLDAAGGGVASEASAQG